MKVHTGHARRMLDTASTLARLAEQAEPSAVLRRLERALDLARGAVADLEAEMVHLQETLNHDS